MNVPEPKSLLDFWFGEIDRSADQAEGGFVTPAIRERWWQANSDFDQQCADLFGAWLEQLDGPDLSDWPNSPTGRLAFILLCDQIPRNVFRGSAKAYAFDTCALAEARKGIDAGDDLSLTFDQRAFFYMPFEHSENIIDQHTAVGLFTALRDQSPKGQRDVTGNYLRFAQQHRDIIVQFGRFPHRNRALGRDSSAAEAAFVAGSDGFGQL